MADAAETTTISCQKRHVRVNANGNQLQRHRHASNRSNLRNQAISWNHSEPNIACWKQTPAHAVHWNQDTTTIAETVFVMSLAMVDAEETKTISKHLKSVKAIAVMYKTCAHCRQFMVVAKKMLPASTMITATMNVINSNIPDAVETKTTSIRSEIVPHNVNDNNNQNHHKSLKSQKSIRYV